MKMTRAELNQILARNKQLSLDEDPPGAFLSRPKPQPLSGQALDAPVSGEAQSGPRFSVRITSYRTRPCDLDNLTGGCKAVLDSIRYAGLVPGDAPWQIEFTAAQVKVAHRKEERTEITIIEN